MTDGIKVLGIHLYSHEVLVLPGFTYGPMSFYSISYNATGERATETLIRWIGVLKDLEDEE